MSVAVGRINHRRIPTIKETSKFYKASVSHIVDVYLLRKDKVLTQEVCRKFRDGTDILKPLPARSMGKLCLPLLFVFHRTHETIYSHLASIKIHLTSFVN